MRKEAKALITGGASIIGVLLVSLLANRPLYPENYATPVEVSATVVDLGVLPQGGGQTYKPVFEFQHNDTTWRVSSPTNSRRSHYALGESIKLIIDANNPNRVADPAHLRSRHESLIWVSLLGTVLIISGLYVHKVYKRKDAANR